MTSAGGATTVTASLVAANVTDVGVGPTGPVPNACDSVCATVNAQCASIGDCLEACQQVQPECADEHQAWLGCLLENDFGSNGACAKVAGCDQELEAYLGCGAACTAGTCAIASNGACGCDRKCGNQLYATKCGPAGNGEYSCECLVNNSAIGKCLGPARVLDACDISHSCCVALFFADG
jgi:hypothetical protein